jgi:regulator of sirC expression with transglutaminase-like and TPR domain
MNLDDTLQQLAVDPHVSIDVAEVALQLARDEYPDLDVEAYLSELAGMAHEATRFLSGDLEARVTGLCRYLFHEMGFRGNLQNYYDPRNSYLNEVLERRTGLPITLCAVVMAIGDRVGLEVVGVGLPGHFVAKALAGSQEVLFDPFHGGRLLTPESCEHLVEQVTGRPFLATPEQLQAISLGRMVQRLLNNLKGVYLRAGDFERTLRTIQRLRQVNPQDPELLRDLGVVQLESGQPGAAIDSLRAYLATSPTMGDVEAIRKLLDRAQGDVAKWN